MAMTDPKDRRIQELEAVLHRVAHWPNYRDLEEVRTLHRMAKEALNGRQGTTICRHSVPTDERCPLC
jgi:hypothetical protein